MNIDVCSVKWGSVDWGSVPAWLALIAGLIAASLGLRNLLLDRQDRRQSQAGKVAAWVGTDTVQKWNDPGEQRIGALSVRSGAGQFVPVEVAGAWLRNASELPIRDVRLSFLHGTIELTHHAEPLVPPATEPQFIRPNTDSHDAVELTFRDNRNRWWKRTADGTLTETAPPSAPPSGAPRWRPRLPTRTRGSEAKNGDTPCDRT